MALKTSVSRSSSSPLPERGSWSRQAAFVDAAGGLGEGGDGGEGFAGEPPTAPRRAGGRQAAPENDARDLGEIIRIVGQFRGVFLPAQGPLARHGHETVIGKSAHRQQRNEHDGGIPESQSGANGHRSPILSDVLDSVY